MFDRDHLEEKKLLEDCLYMACMNPKAGNFFVDTRLQRHFTTFACLMPSTETMQAIYNSILGGHFS
jgi:dynein heavy chain